MSINYIIVRLLELVLEWLIDSYKLHDPYFILFPFS